MANRWNIIPRDIKNLFHFSTQLLVNTRLNVKLEPGFQDSSVYGFHLATSINAVAIRLSQVRPVVLCLVNAWLVEGGNGEPGRGAGCLVWVLVDIKNANLS